MGADLFGRKKCPAVHGRHNTQDRTLLTNRSDRGAYHHYGKLAIIGKSLKQFREKQILGPRVERLE